MASQNTSFANLTIYNVFQDDVDIVGQLLDDDVGIKNTSNMQKIDKILQSNDSSINTLKTQVNNLILKDSTIYEVGLTKVTSGAEGVTVYQGTTTEFTSYKDGNIYLFYFDNDNDGIVQFNINNIGYYYLKKIKNGNAVSLETGDIRKNVKYLALFRSSGDNNFILIGENGDMHQNQYDVNGSVLAAGGIDSYAVSKTGLAQSTGTTTDNAMSQASITEELDKRQTKDTALTRNTATILSPYSAAPGVSYMKDAYGWVTVTGAFSATSAPTSANPIFQLPAGYRPSMTTVCFLVQAFGTGMSWCTWANVGTDGRLLVVATNTNGFASGVGIGVSCVFKAAL